MNNSDRQYRAKQYQHKPTCILIFLLVALVLGGCSSLRAMREPVRVVPGGDAVRGARAIRHYGCGSCHTIPGIAGADSTTGPPLNDWGDRHFISGRLPNEPEYLIEWVRFPQAIEPGTAMPNMGVTEQDARDIGAYLFSLRRNRSNFDFKE